MNLVVLPDGELSYRYYMTAPIFSTKPSIALTDSHVTDYFNFQINVIE